MKRRSRLPFRSPKREAPLLKQPCPCGSKRKFRVCCNKLEPPIHSTSAEVTEEESLRARSIRGLAHLYRYGKLWGEEEAHRDIELFQESKIFRASPRSINDPFDCQVRFSTTPTDNEFRKYVRRQKQQILGLRGWELAEQVGAEIKIGYHRNATTLRNTLLPLHLDAVERTLGIYCLSRVPDSVLMWAYYAAGHTGYCLMYANRGRIGEAFEVSYSTDYPHYDYFDTPYKQAKAGVLTKFMDWSHEQEYRLLSNKGSGLERMTPDLLEGVILGCKMAAEQEEVIRDLCSKRLNQVDIFRAQPSDDSYTLNVVPA